MKCYFWNDVLVCLHWARRHTARRDAASYERSTHRRTYLDSHTCKNRIQYVRIHITGRCMKEWSRKERFRKYFYVKAMYSRYIKISIIQEVVLTMSRHDVIDSCRVLVYADNTYMIYLWYEWNLLQIIVTISLVFPSNKSRINIIWNPRCNMKIK